MSVLVQMKMPKNCIVCDVERQANCIVWQGVEPSKTGRHENCPLVEIPPHGRLIDADALYEKITDSIGGIDCAKLLDEDFAPTIIEAEDGEA